MAQRVLTLLAETPVHAGGSEAAGIVDLPIQRETATRLPVIWGQSLKGALRDALRHRLGDEEDVAVFGSSIGTGHAGTDTTPGGVAFGDAQLLLFPAATSIHTFAWVTSPQVLARLRRKLLLLGTSAGRSLELRSPPGASFVGSTAWQGARQVVGPFVQPVRSDTALANLAAVLAGLVFPADGAFDHARRKMSTDVLAADDGVLSELAETATEIVARVQLTADKTVENGPFYSEHLPAETVMAAVLSGREPLLARLTELLDGHAVQIGGDETIGKGLMWCRVHDAASLQRPPQTETEAKTEAAPDSASPEPQTAPVTPRPPAGAAGRPSPASIPKRARS